MAESIWEKKKELENRGPDNFIQICCMKAEKVAVPFKAHPHTDVLQSDCEMALCVCFRSLSLLCTFVDVGLCDHLTVETAGRQDFRLSPASI